MCPIRSPIEMWVDFLRVLPEQAKILLDPVFGCCTLAQPKIPAYCY